MCPIAIQNFTVGDVDTEGRPLVGDNRVHVVSYYDSTSESWLRDYTVPPVNPFVNADFSAPTVTGTGQWYDDSSDLALNPRFFKFSKAPFDFDNELFAEFGTRLASSTTSTNSANYPIGSFFVNTTSHTSPPRNVFPGNYEEGWYEGASVLWATTSGVPGKGEGFVIIDFGNSPQEVAGFYLDSAHLRGSDAGARDGWISSYTIQVATTGTGLDPADYTAIASGTIGYNLPHPVWIDVPPTTAKYVRLLFRNHGDATDTHLHKFFAYSKEVIDSGMSSLSHRVLGHDSSTARTFKYKQGVDLTGIDYIYFDVKDYARDSSRTLEFYVDGSKVDGILSSQPLSGSFTYHEHRGYSLDVSAFNGNKTVEFRKSFRSLDGTMSGVFCLARVTTVPTWFSEPVSTKRGSSAAFPSEVIIVVDSKGLSIVDAKSILLWMRFDFGPRKMLQQIPRAVSARNGKLYLATSRGLFIIDFPGNKAVRYDERGVFQRFGIDYRNINAFDREEVDASGASSPQRMIYEYSRSDSSIVIPYNDTYDLALGTDDTIGDFVFVGTGEGAILLVESTNTFYTSLDRSPVYNVTISNNTIWYTQGRESSTSTVGFIRDVNTVAVSNFIPETVYRQDITLTSPLSGDVDTDVWDIISQDPGMSILTGDYVTVSGSHTKGGATGLLYKTPIENRSFTAKLKVKIDTFPLDARGALRFGFVYDYLGEGPKSLKSISELDGRSGFFLSALNINPYRGHLIEDATFTDGQFDTERGWILSIGEDSGNPGEEGKTTTPTPDGLHFVADAPTTFNGDQNLNRVVSAWPFIHRDFTARIQVKLVDGFDVHHNSGFENPGAWLGLSSRGVDMAPGTGAQSGNYIENAMLISGNTGLGPNLFYGLGSYNSNANTDPTDLNLNITVDAPENQGLGSPFREWRIDYDHAVSRLTGHIDGQQINQRVGLTNQPPRTSLTFGLYNRTQSVLGNQEPRNCFIKNFTITYPPLASGSRYKYGLETTELGAINNVLSNYTTYSGIALSPNTSPANSPLVYDASLSDGILHSGGTAMGASTSIGVDLVQPRTVEALFFYDNEEGTSGWNSSSSKRVDLWTSEDNQFWSFYRQYDLNKQERTLGVTKLNFSPAVEARFLQIRGIDPTGNYAVGGGASWAISEAHGITLSGVDFFTTDATASSEFHEWKLIYDANTGEIEGYIDDSLISKAYFSDPIDYGNFIISHDLTPVNSGTGTVFSGSFKDFEVTFSGAVYRPAGTITSLSVNHNVISGGDNNYTLLTATRDGVGVADFEVGPAATLPNTFRLFDHPNDILGDSTYVPVVFGDKTSHRNKGLLFVGTGSCVPARFTRRYYKPTWVERWTDSASSAISIYGNRVSLVYHPGEDKFMMLFSALGSYFVTFDLNRGTSTYVSRRSYRDAVGLSATAEYQRDTAILVYSPYDNRIYLLASVDKLVSVDFNAGDAIDHPNSATIRTDSGNYHLSYILHKHVILYGDEFISHWDVINNTEVQHPRNFSSSNFRWNRFRTKSPWFSADLTNAAQSGVYCDYDKCVYFLGSTDTGNTTANLFYRYNPDKDYLEFISGGQDSAVWPITDEELAKDTPVRVGFEKSHKLVYHPDSRRVYTISSRYTTPQLAYYDVVSNEWVRPGHDVPYNGLRNWPGAEVSPSSNNDVNFVAYDNNTKSIVLFGRGEDPELYEYRPDHDLFDRGFNYRPIVDGLPTSSGVNYHFTTDSTVVKANYPNSSEFSKDFYFTGTDSVQRYKYTFGSDFITISGSSPSSQAADDVREHYVASEVMDPTRSFEVSTMVALPKFTRNIFANTGAGSNDQAHSYFVMGLSDGVNRSWVNSTWGQRSPDIFQRVEVRAGVSGVVNDAVTEYPFKGHLVYIDSENNENHSITAPNRSQHNFSSYGTGVDLVEAFSDFREFKLKYTYETDMVEGFIDSVSVGATQLRRKFDASGGVRFHLGFESQSDNDVANDHQWVANVKNFKVGSSSWDRIEKDRLITSISGSIGTHRHEKWDSTLTSGTDWVYDTDVYLPTNTRFTGFNYVASLAGVGDGHKLTELVAYLGPSNQKRVALISSLDNRDDSSTYLGFANHTWDDLEIGQYKIIRDTKTDTVNVYIQGEETPSISVAYEALPPYKFQHIYYGKVNYGNFERIYESPSLIGTWVSTPNFTGGSDPAIGRRAFNGSASFATVTQLNNARAIYDLDTDLGNVDLYVFYHAEGFDTAMNTPYTVLSSGVSNLPTDVGEGKVIFEIESSTDEFGNLDSNKTTVRVDQRRKRDNEPTSTNKNLAESSGWVYIGRYDRPSQVIVSADAVVATSSTQGFVCADAIGADIGKYGRSTFDMSIKHVRYQTGTTELTPEPFESSGISVIELSTDQRIDSYGEQTAPTLLDNNLTSGSRLE